MLFLITHLLTQDADACSPAIQAAEVINTLPVNGSLGVAVDAVIHLELTEGLLPEDMSIFTLRQGDSELEIAVDIVLNNTSLLEEHSIISISPLEKLGPNQQFVLEQAGEPLMTFRSADQIAATIEDVPLIWAEKYFIDNTEQGFTNSCQPNTQTNIDLIFGQDYEQENRGVVIYQVDERGNHLLGEPFAMLLDSEFSSLSVAQKYTTVDDEFCFAAAFINEAGEEGELSDVFCAAELSLPDYACGFGPFGCATTNPDSLAWISLGCGLFGLSRRRRK